MLKTLKLRTRIKRSNKRQIREEKNMSRLPITNGAYYTITTQDGKTFSGPVRSMKDGKILIGIALEPDQINNIEPISARIGFFAAVGELFASGASSAASAVGTAASAVGTIASGAGELFASGASDLGNIMHVDEVVDLYTNGWNLNKAFQRSKHEAFSPLATPKPPQLDYYKSPNKLYFHPAKCACQKCENRTENGQFLYSPAP